MASEKLLDNVSVDTTGDPFPGDGGTKLLVISGTNLDGGTITIEMSLDGGANYAPATYNGAIAAFTEFQTLLITKIAQKAKIRAKLTGAGGSAAAITVGISD